MLEEIDLEEYEKEGAINKNFDSTDEDELESYDLVNEKNNDLKTHEKIKINLCGNIIELDSGYSKTTLQTTQDMVLDDLGLIHSGFIFGAADYAAAIAVNEANFIVIDSRSQFLAPAKLNDLIEFEATAKFENSRKREIKVIANINEIKIFEGIFHAVILEEHILKRKAKEPPKPPKLPKQ
ncbi:MAG: PaaI family thioesterase [Sulfurospirillum sp.]|nr:PaaI family thioesterase [Sulfurospirillum sp.]MBL0703444.1 PaaI family thioesterase [Sulfurospirillum sp.]